VSGAGERSAKALNTGMRARVREVAQRAVPVAGRLTLGGRQLPGALVIGAQRAGTTSLHRALAEHPELHPPVLHKGVHYFDTAYGHPLAWYRAHFPRGGGTGFETCPYYLAHPVVPSRVAADLPDVRVVALLRDPVERAVSHHAHEVARGFEDLDLEAAIEAEPERLAGAEERLRDGPRSLVDVHHQHHAYLARGAYAPQLRRWFDAVGRDAVLVLDAAPFLADPAAGLPRVLDHLGVAPAADLVVGRWNAGRPATIPAALRHRLEEHFAPLDADLVDLLGWRPSWIRS
jgi:hypothetical protein